MANTDEWKPKRTIQEVHTLMTAPGGMHEMELAVIHDRVYRVYKNTPPSLRSLWLMTQNMWANRSCIVFEKERYTYAQLHERVNQLASLLYSTYGIRKGDRVAIAMRNFPEALMSFWAGHLIGAVVTMVNVWTTPEVFSHSLNLTNPKVVLVDPERANFISSSKLANLNQLPLRAKVLVARHHEGRGRSSWKGMTNLDDALKAYSGSGDSWSDEPEAELDDDGMIFFTSGTTGLPKGVLLSQRACLSSILNSIFPIVRSIHRKGEEMPKRDQMNQHNLLLGIPLFHVTAVFSGVVISTFSGSAITLMRGWNTKEALRLIKEEKITNTVGVPTILADLIQASLSDDTTLELVMLGGASMPKQLFKEASKRLPKASTGQGYGLTETAAGCVSVLGEDCHHRPTSAGLAVPIIDILIVDPATKAILPPNEPGEIWIRGACVMKGYWNDPEATKKAMTQDGWFKTGDIGSLDEEGFLYILDRIKDLIIRGGENIHCSEVENAIHGDERLADVAVVGVPDDRLGELVSAVVTPKLEYLGKVKEEEVIGIAKKSLHAKSVPVMILVRDQPLERNAAGKVLKDVVRKQAREEWEKRKKGAGSDRKDKKIRSRAKL